MTKNREDLPKRFASWLSVYRYLYTHEYIDDKPHRICENSPELEVIRREYDKKFLEQKCFHEFLTKIENLPDPIRIRRITGATWKEATTHEMSVDELLIRFIDYINGA